MEDLITTLKEENLRVTSYRKDILNALKNAKEPLPIAKIYDLTSSKNSSLNLTTIYRNIEALEAIGLVQKLNFRSNESLYELKDPNSHHHHLVCVNCGKVIDLEKTFQEDFLDKIAKDYQFKLVDHSFEIYGLCPDCQAKVSVE